VDTLSLVSHAAGAGLFLVLSVLLAFGWRGRRPEGGLLLLASVFSTAWFALLAAESMAGVEPGQAVAVLEVLRTLTWLLFLVRVLGYRGEEGADARLSSAARGLLGLGVLVLVGVVAGPWLDRWVGSLVDLQRAILAGHVLLAVGGLVLVEQLFRNTPVDRRWAVKFLCFALGGIFAYDFYLYADALLFQRVDPGLWAARGAINAVVVPLLAVSAKRNADWAVQIFASKTVVFHSVTLVGAGAYLLLMAAVGYYIRAFGGAWGTALQALFLFGAAVLLALLLFSGAARARVKLFLNRHFFEYKYDYREEWLRLIGTLAGSTGGEALKQNAIRAVAAIVEATGGMLWMRADDQAFVSVARLDMPDLGVVREPANSGLVRFLEREEYVVDVTEHAREPELYPLELPEWLRALPRAWLVVPLMQGSTMLGFIVLAESRAHFTFNWEDTDLLKTVGRQVASYLALMRANEALSEARQFEAFNRVSAFVVHDLKNVIAQLSLLVSNAKRHMHNPLFVEDAMRTVDNAVGRMTRMLEQLRKDRLHWKPAQRMDLTEVLAEVAQARSVQQPAPRLECAARGLCILADPDRLGAVLGHLVQNAQEATGPTGHVSLRLAREERGAVIEVEDDGVGMDPQFVRERLFKPFDTTKGNAGMGVGVYEAREFVRAHGGTIEVRSAPGEGTTFRIRFPLADEREGLSAAASA
jgi:putative PEP-CTERM system histidine kinase